MFALSKTNSKHAHAFPSAVPALTQRHLVRAKDDVLWIDVEQDFDVLFRAIEQRRPEELSATARLVMTTPALQAKALYLMVDLQ